jgi:cap2 methyltransferase
MEQKKYYVKNNSISEICTIVNNIFQKSFDINDNENYVLPKPESMFIEHHWEVEELQIMKRDLNEIKSKLNNYNYTDWHRHTSQRNKAKNVEWRIRQNFDPEFVTQAWCKFHEVLSKYPLIPKENIFMNNNKFLSLHLCEAPGAFISCLNHWLKTNLPTVYWDWLAMTLNPYYEGNSNNQMISDDRFIIYSLNNWFFGHDSTGDLMNIENLDSLIEKVKSKGKVNLITADGSIDCNNNPGEQEKIVANLHFCEVVAAINILETGGNFMLKMFTIFEHQSICLIYLLSCIFNKVHFYKPVTSKEGNSEVYLICLKFKGLEFVLPYLSILRKVFEKNSDQVMFSKNDIPENFLKQIVSCAKIFKDHQCKVIEDNIVAYNYNENLNTNYAVRKIADLVADKFMIVFPLQKLHTDLQIVGNFKLKKVMNKYWKGIASESFSERQKNQFIKPLHRLLMYKNQLKFSFKTVSQSLVFKVNIFNYILHIYYFMRVNFFT